MSGSLVSSQDLSPSVLLMLVLVMPVNLVLSPEGIKEDKG